MANSERMCFFRLTRMVVELSEALLLEVLGFEREADMDGCSSCQARWTITLLRSKHDVRRPQPT